MKCPGEHRKFERSGPGCGRGGRGADGKTRRIDLDSKAGRLFVPLSRN